MTGALEAGGQAIGVLADSLERAALKREHRKYIQDGRLVLVCPYDPSAGFNIGHAMQRNKLIYGLADASLVMSCDLEKGGTWAGAIEQLDRLHYVPVYVRAEGESSPGLSALLQQGGIAWPDPRSVASFEATLQVKNGNSLAELNQHRLNLSEPATEAQGSEPALETAPDLPMDLEEAVVSKEPFSANPPHSAELPPGMEPSEAFFMSVRQAFQMLLKEPLKEADIASQLQVSRPQVKLWLKRLIEEGFVSKHQKPAGYVSRQSRLFR